LKCHAYDDKGGNAGPRLNGIATKISRQQILEALIAPSARLSPGYGMVSLELRDGKKLFGTVEKENETSITLKIGGEPAQWIQKNQVAKRIDAQSSMPDMKQTLSKREIRDIVSFLATLKENN
jgi:quinoprotein glucose dehydrogenase